MFDANKQPVHRIADLETEFSSLTDEMFLQRVEILSAARAEIHSMIAPLQEVVAELTVKIDALIADRTPGEPNSDTPPEDTPAVAEQFRRHGMTGERPSVNAYPYEGHN